MRIREGFISVVRCTWVLKDGGDVNRHVGEGRCEVRVAWEEQMLK